jgi:hypothetical protein
MNNYELHLKTILIKHTEETTLKRQANSVSRGKHPKVETTKHELTLIPSKNCQLYDSKTEWNETFV